jgi:regulator of protease activity HflC (stomatin/prohibitin superfamily)
MSRTAIIASVCVGVLALALLMFTIPQYRVYSERLGGEAELAHAEFSKRIAVQTAQAKLDSAKLDAQTDIVRAEGVAKANKILAESLGGPEGYLRWKYIEMLDATAHNRGRDVIYVPTEGALPIFEAGKRPVRE